MRVDMSSTAFLEEGWEKKLDECRKYCDSVGWELGIQFHNTAPADQIGKIARCGVPMSAHAPLDQRRNWNLAAEDVSSVFRAMEENAALFAEKGISMSVFHGGYMSDLIPEAFGHGKTYFQCMAELYRPELSIGGGSFLNRDFTSCEEFGMRYSRLKENLAEVRRRFPQITFCLENDFPAFGSLNMFPHDMVKLGHPLCLDMGHLWISAHLADLDFHQEIGTGMKSGLVKMCHFHASVWNNSVPKERWRDGHMPLTVVNPQEDLRRAAKIMYQNGLRYFVLEIGQGSVNDIRILHDYLQ